MHKAFQVFYLIAVLLISLVLAWQVIKLGYAKHQFGRFAELKGIDVYNNVYKTNPNNLGNLFKLARYYSETGDYKRSNKFLAEALAVDPSYGRAMSLYVRNYQNLSETQRAEQAANYAVQLWPAHSFVRRELFSFWDSLDNKEKMMEQLNVLLLRQPSQWTRSEIYKLLDTWVEDPKNRQLLLPYLITPPSWWESYFSHLAHQKGSLDQLEFLYQRRLRKGKAPLSEREISVLVSKLTREKQWRRAYRIWSESLSDELKKYNNGIFDGGFESAEKNSFFTWNLQRSKTFDAKIATSYGVSGRRALWVKFKQKKPVNFKGVFQRVSLPSGNVTISMKARVDGSIGEKGLKWRLRCINNNQLLGESKAFISRDPWRETEFDAVIPTEDCEVQMLRLEASSHYVHHQIFSGALWFDQIGFGSTRTE